MLKISILPEMQCPVKRGMKYLLNSFGIFWKVNISQDGNEKCHSIGVFSKDFHEYYAQKYHFIESSGKFHSMLIGNFTP